MEKNYDDLNHDKQQAENEKAESEARIQNIENNINVLEDCKKSLTNTRHEIKNLLYTHSNNIKDIVIGCPSYQYKLWKGTTFSYFKDTLFDASEEELNNYLKQIKDIEDEIQKKINNLYDEKIAESQGLKNITARIEKLANDIKDIFDN